jgi:hypothetical protein
VAALFFGEPVLALRHCEERSDEAIQHFLCRPMDCFASLAMTAILLKSRFSGSGEGLS